ncbi:TB2/DP1, HVA22 family protein [Trichomonas vaginalis G3]|uniref:TB2/DP1, HVA22 family protein n=1 Tax=Trichomonas vaginalis (strain ATCC PRA-98 / G3) TaxID=412133 RepID=A2FVC2_TRIV3|nr:guanylate cyclase protein [Trichomonas vaginalis G3]EAX91142.1 TB2/DP1, HVA22 family protein [Trichomonas vaginalis G3]KAI5483898.1 guanylate cyclase protein [Trichomonas vaginalis G3]|eukprot:XP_001304072.1 TB2/DP1, HVA22 family protein [Trichomonas vaginalis G3]
MTEENKSNPNDIINSSFKADYPGIMDVSPIEKVQEWLFNYYARIQTDTKPQYIFSMITSVFLCIQSIFPAFVYHAYKQRETSVIASILRFLSVIWIGGATFDGAEYTSIVFSCITLIIFRVLVFRAYIYSRLKSMKPTEIALVYGISTFLLPILLSFTTCTIGVSIDSLARKGADALKIVALILSIITFLLQVYAHYTFISPRIMFIRDVTLMWTPGSAAFIPLTTGILSALFTAALTNNGVPATVELVIMIIYSIAVSSYLFLDSMFLNKILGHVYCALLITNGTANIINIVANYVKIDYNIIFFIIIVFVILSYLIFHFIHSKFSQISMVTLDAAAQDEYFYGRSDNLARDVRRSLDYCSPGVFMFPLYDNFLDDDITQCTDMLFVYARVVSAFPSYKYKLEVINDKLKESKIPCRRILNFQIDLLMSHRNTAATHQVVKAFENIESHSKILLLNIKKFWENVLHGNTDTFWANIHGLDLLTTDLKKELNQIVNDYENCPEVISLAVKLHSSQTFNFDEARRLRSDLDLLEKGIPAHKDRALTNMMGLFPNVMNSISDLTKEIDIVGTAIHSDIDFDQMSKREVTSDLIKNSKLGNWGIKALYFGIAAIITIGFYLLFVLLFKERALDEITNTFSFLVDANTLLHSFSRYFFTKVLYYAYQQPDSIFLNDTTTMNIISPFWYPAGHAKMVDISDHTILNIANQIRDGLQNMSTGLGDLDTSRAGILDFVDSYNNYKFNSTSQTISESIISVMMINDYDETFVNTTFEIYDKFKSILTTISSKLTFLSSITENMNWMVLSLLVTFFVWSLPLMLTFFKITIQMEEIANSFSKLPSNEIRKLINSDSKKDESENTSLITTSSINSLRGPLYVGTFLTVVPAVVLCYGFYFYTKGMITNSDDFVRSGAVLKTAMSDLRISFLATTIAFLNSYPDTKYNQNIDLVKRLLSLKDKKVDEARLSNSLQLLKSKTQIDNWIRVQEDYRWLFSPLDESEDKIPIAKANWERLASFGYIQMLDTFIFVSKLTQPQQATSKSNANYNAYFLWWVYDAVESAYYDVLSEQTSKDLPNGHQAVPVFIALYVICTLFTLGFIIYEIWRYTENIKVAMRMLILVDLDIIMGHQQLLNLIQSGRSSNEVQKSEFNYSDQYYLNHCREGIAIVDKNLDIVEFNNAFSQMLPDCKNVKELSSDQLSLSIFNVFENKGEVRFSSNISTTNTLGVPVHANVDVIAMHDTRPVLQNENIEITSCAIILQDVSSFIDSEQKIKAKHKAITEMLLKILPESTLNDLQNGQDSVSFTVHSISVGGIQIIINSEMDVQQKFRFYATLYKGFDELMKQFSTLNKLKTFAGQYIYTGGLFMSINKPEKHAEESVKFVVELLKALPSLKQALEADFSLKIGIHTGGPVIAGVLSPDFPSFQILGNVDKFAEKMTKVCELDKVRVTRSVYELIFSAGFRITENEPMKIGTETVQSYTIDVK